MPQLDRADFPGVQTVRFRYVVNPHYYEIEPGTHLCDDLKSAERSTVEMRILRTDHFLGLQGRRYHPEAIDGRTYVPAGAWVRNGITWTGQNVQLPNPINDDPLTPRKHD